jgi:gamma-glutamyltranspeptidase/glutathione hydrolase
MTANRRDFLKAAASSAVAAGGAVAAGLANGLSAESALATIRQAAGSSSVRGGTPGAMTPEERRRLVASATFGSKAPASGKGGMMICAHPLATRAGADMLRAGGNAADAVLAAAVTQTVVEPHMTGVTGVFSLLYYDAKTGTTDYINGGMNAPLAKLTGWGPNATATGLGAGVPGFWAGFEASLAKHGTKSKKDLCAAAIAYARDGFEVHPFMWGELYEQMNLLGKSDQGREIFFPNNRMVHPGEMLFQKRAADTLDRLVSEGNHYFYQGAFAKNYSATVQAAGGVITPEDFARYEVRYDEPARGTYRGYQLIGSPVPDHGGMHVIDIMNMLEFLDLKKIGPVNDSPETLWQMVRISAQVFADGGRHRDPKFHRVPVAEILSKEYAKMRFDLLQMDAPLPKAASEAVPPAGSCHVTAVDAAGNVATALHSCMSLPWSNGLFVDGVTIVASGAHFFRVMPGPGERASVYVAPCMVLTGGKPMIACGSPSGSLLQNIVQNYTNMLDFGVPLPESVNRPRFGNAYTAVGGALLAVEADFRKDVADAVRARGMALDTVNSQNYGMGSFEGIHIDPSTGVRTARGDTRRCSMAEAV